MSELARDLARLLLERAWDALAGAVDELVSALSPTRAGLADAIIRAIDIYFEQQERLSRS